MGLLYGTVACDCLWLALGESSIATQKIFQFSTGMSIPVRVRGDYLVAYSKPQEATIAVESNGGSGTVTVRIDVPIKPFTRGVLAGATTPRQIIEKTKAAPTEAARLFADGSVANWYRQNGWSYPVQAPAASGIEAVLQFFKALGLTDASAPSAIPLPGPPDPTAPIAKLIISFPFGVLSGALTPRELIQKVQAAPAEAAGLFDNGAVAAWYKENGWTYPVKGPTASGQYAVRQFLQAVGLANEPGSTPNPRSPVVKQAQLIQPFSEGILAGAWTPRQLVDLAQERPRKPPFFSRRELLPHGTGRMAGPTPCQRRAIRGHTP